METFRYHSIAVDILKGIGIILVVLGHTCHNNLNGWISNFHMPLFFIVSGLFLKPGHDVYFKRSKSIIIPYFIFSIVSYLYWRFLEIRFRPIDDNFDANTHFLDIFWQMHKFEFNVVLWFLPCLFFATILLNIILLRINKRPIILLVCLLWSIVLSFYMPDSQSLWINETLCAIPFVTIGWLLGVFLSKIDDKLKNTPWYYRISALLPLLAIVYIPHGGGMMDSIYPNGYLYYFITALICVIAVYILSTLLTSQNWLSWLGRNTLAIMCLHEPLKRIVIKIFAIATHQSTDELRESTILSVLVTAVVILSLVPVCKLINKRLPWILGRF
jgi:fucose 4-O-acetylase-like acetyltransferase